MHIFDIVKSESMQISFDGQSHQIDANILVNTLIHYSTVIQEANNELSGGSRTVQVNINALKEGSFIIDISLSEGIKGLFSSDTITYLAGLSTIVGSVFQVYKHLKGKPIKKSDDININIKGNNNQVNIQNVVKIYNNRVVRQAISQSIETVSDAPEIESITLSGDRIENVTFKRDDFPELIYTDFDNEDIRSDEIDEYVDAELVIIGMKFEKGGKWSFIYNGFKIGIVVKDDILMQKIDEGERFGKGDSIRVKMKITKKFNPEFNVYENKSYKIVEFYEHVIHHKAIQKTLL